MCEPGESTVEDVTGTIRRRQQRQLAERKRLFLAAAAGGTNADMLLPSHEHQQQHSYSMGFIKEDEIYGHGGDGVAVANSSAVGNVPVINIEAATPEVDEDNKQINHSASPFRRWGQSSLRSRSNEPRTPNTTHRRPSSLAASESDVYTKSIDDDYSSTKSGYNPYSGHVETGGATLAVDSTQTATVATGSGPVGVSSWGTSFEKLLEDPSGLHTFSEFLKKEFSAENIYFWTACERYRQINERDERAREAQAIFVKHLESGCSEPVNVDSIARNIALENLPQAETTLFAAAQKQIFNLMKFDSYQRFIKSDMYRACQEAESKGQQLPYPGEQLDPLLRISFAVQNAATKLKKSLSNAEDRRRKSLLPWHRKTRCKSKDRGDSEMSKKDGGKALSNGGSNGGSGGGGGGSSNTLKVLSNNSNSDIHSSRSSLASFDAAIGKSYDPDDTRSPLCRVILSNGATTVVQTRSNETIKELVERLLEKRGIVYNAYEAFLAGSTKPLDLDGPSSSLAGREVNIDQRVVFKLSLPNRKMISVKSKATKPLGDVLRPILLKYNYELDQMKVYAKEALLDIKNQVTSVDGLWLQIRNGTEPSIDSQPDIIRPLGRPLEKTQTPFINTAAHHQIINHFQQQLQQPPSVQSSQHNFAIPSANAGNGTAASSYLHGNIAKKSSGLLGTSGAHSNNNNNNNVKSREEDMLNMLDEITNKVFNELMHVKTANGKVPEDCTSDSSSTRRDRFRRRGSNAPSDSGRGAKSKKCSTGGSEDGGESVNNVGVKKPIIAKLKAGVKLQMPTRSQNDELLEGLKRAQRSRLEDQRGTEINFELPDFLKDKENFTNPTANGSGPSGPSKFSRKPARRSEFAPPALVAAAGASTEVAGSQNNKPQPAPRLSITSQRNGGGSSKNINGNSNNNNNGIPCSPVQSAVSDSNLNLSTQCNASPHPVDDNYNGNGSQSENSYADTTLVFTHAPQLTSASSRSAHQQHPAGLGIHDDHHTDRMPAGGINCCSDSSPESSPGGHLHGHHHHHHHHASQHHHHHHHHGHHYHQSRYQQQTSQHGNGNTANGNGTLDTDHHRGPPPLPPKPKILPIKPSNWGHTGSSAFSGATGMSASMCNLSTSSAALTNGGSNTGTSSSTTSSSGSSGSSSNLSSSNTSTGGGGGGGGTSGTVTSKDGTGGRRSAGTPNGLDSNGNGSVPGTTVAQARSVYFDQANSSFV